MSCGYFSSESSARNLGMFWPPANAIDMIQVGNPYAMPRVYPQRVPAHSDRPVNPDGYGADPRGQVPFAKQPLPADTSNYSSNLATGPAGRGRRNRGRLHHANKRALFPMINSKIISAADSCDLALLVATIEVNMPNMNLVNLSTALHRLAKISAGDPEAQAGLRSHKLVTEMRMAVRAALERAETNDGPPQCQALSNIIWALATMKIVDPVLVVMTAQQTLRKIRHFKPFELSASVWAFAKLQAIDPATEQHAVPVFQVTKLQILANVTLFSFRCLVIVLNGFVEASQIDEVLLQCLSEPLAAGLVGASTQEILNVAWTYSHNGYGDAWLFNSLSARALQRIRDFKNVELCQVLGDCAAAGCANEEFFVAAMQSLKWADLQGFTLATLASMLAHKLPSQRVTQELLLRLLLETTTHLEGLDGEELAALALAAARCFPPQSLDIKFASGSPRFVLQEFFHELSQVFMKAAQITNLALVHVMVSFIVIDNAMGAGTILSPDLAAEMGCEIMSHVKSLETGISLLCLKALLFAPQGTCGGTICVLFTEVLRHLDTFTSSERRALAEICSRIDGAPQESYDSKALRHSCSALTQSQASLATIRLTPRQEDMTMLLEKVGPCLLDTLKKQDREVGDSEASVRAPSPPHSTKATSSKDEGSQEKNVLPVVQVEVRNTFLHIPDDEMMELEEDMLSPNWKLDPPLDFIPSSISGDQLEAYRMGYQNFRTGRPLGAKGEVTNLNEGGASSAANLEGLDLATNTTAYVVGDPHANKRRGAEIPGISPSNHTEGFGSQQDERDDQELGRSDGEGE